jgi:hypothetical protein
MRKVERITQARLRSVVRYDKDTGLFTRLECKQRPDVVGLGGGPNGNGYLRLAIDGNRYYCHRLAWFYVTGKWPEEIDHINGDRSDNRWINLRDATRQINAQNIPRANAHSKSGVRGVSWDSERCLWTVRIRVDKTYKYMGRFDDLEEAGRAYVAAKRKYHAGFVA